MSNMSVVFTCQNTLLPIEDVAELVSLFSDMSSNSQNGSMKIEGQFVFKSEDGRGILKLICKGFDSPIDSRIQRALDFIRKYYEDNISISQIAHSAYLSTYYFCRLFRKEMKMSVAEYLNHFRIGRSKELLAQTKLPITQICFNTGFNSLTNFERVFKRLESCTPSRYRLERQNQ